MKYMGSKQRLAKYIAPIINELIKQNNINTYLEPFVGGANMIEYIQCENKIGSDYNNYLIEMWKAFQKGWMPPQTISKEEYIDIRDNKEKYPKELVAVTGFCATYNAKWFGGYAGIVNTKIGTKRNYYDESIRNILKQVDNLKDVDFHCKDYREWSNLKNTLIYCDPPYQNTTDYKIEFNHDELWKWVEQMSINNIVLVSEYNAPNNYKCIFEKQLTTTLDKNSRKKDTEKLFLVAS